MLISKNQKLGLESLTLFKDRGSWCDLDTIEELYKLNIDDLEPENFSVRFRMNDGRRFLIERYHNPESFFDYDTSLRVLRYIGSSLEGMPLVDMPTSTIEIFELLDHSKIDLEVIEFNPLYRVYKFSNGINYGLYIDPEKDKWEIYNERQEPRSTKHHLWTTDVKGSTNPSQGDNLISKDVEKIHDLYLMTEDEFIEKYYE